MRDLTKPVPDAVYNRLFELDADGAAVLDELTSKYMLRQSHTPGDPYETAFREGQRAVVFELMQKAGESTQEVSK
jgi:hypothetical protein